MTNRTQEIEKSLAALAAALLHHRQRVVGAASTAEDRSLNSLEHGWDAVAQGYETAATDLTEIAGELQDVGDQADACTAILHSVTADQGLNAVAERLATALAELDTGLDGILNQLDIVRSTLSATGEEYLIGIMHSLVEGVTSSAEQLANIRKDISQEQDAASPAEAGTDAPDSDSPATLAKIQARIQELRRQGHTPQRHGSQVTDQQLTDRALWGKDPMTGTTTDGETGGTHNYGRNATKFTSDKALVDAERHMRTAPDFESQKKDNEITGDVRIRLEIPLRDIFGAGYQNHVHGIRRPGSKTKPTGDPPGDLQPSNTDFTDGTMFAFFKKSDDGEYKLRTMYPKPKDES